MGNDSVIYIRTDGNSKIATGHFVRCLCIAQELEKLGQKICFLVSDEISSALLQELSVSIFPEFRFSFQILVLKTAVFDNLNLEIDELCRLIADKMPTILVDSYYVTPQYFNALKEVSRVVYMDDLRAFDYDVDVVINYDVIPLSKEKEYRLSYTKAKVCLLGAMYTPLREQFKKQKIIIKEKMQKVFITTGGSDPYHFTKVISSFLLKQNLDLEFHIVIGRLFDNDNKEVLQALARENKKVHLYQNVADMAALMKQCDYAISAAGTTLYELCALGIPSISVSFADNQVPMAKTFDETQAVPYAGDIRAGKTEGVSLRNTVICNNILSHLAVSMNDYEKRKKQHETMQDLIDGNGAFLIAEKLIVI